MQGSVVIAIARQDRDAAELEAQQITQQGGCAVVCPAPQIGAVDAANCETANERPGECLAANGYLVVYDKGFPCHRYVNQRFPTD